MASANLSRHWHRPTRHAEQSREIPMRKLKDSAAGSFDSATLRSGGRRSSLHLTVGIEAAMWYTNHMLRFTKMNGAGNDFVMIDNRSGDVHLSAQQIAKICDRHRGVGGWGVVWRARGPQRGLSEVLLQQSQRGGAKLRQGGAWFCAVVRRSGA